MITEHDLQEAIAELQGRRNPTSSDCVKLAAYYTILQNITDTDDEIRGAVMSSYSRAEPPQSVGAVDYTFTNPALKEGLRGRTAGYICELLDDLVSAVKVTNPELYGFVVRKMQA